MSDDDIPTVDDHIGDMFHCFDRSVELVGHGLVMFIQNECVSSDGYNG
jgi:hypothetical protein